MSGQLELLREQVPPPAFHALMNLISSHDQPRALWVLGDKGPATPAEQRALARARLRLAMLLQFSYPGAPSLYYGDEVGLGGGDDPYNRAPYPWADQGGQPDEALQREVARLIGLRHRHPVLSLGRLLAPLHVDDAVMVLARRLPPAAGRGGPQGSPAAAATAWAVTAYSNADSDRQVSVQLPPDLPAGTVLTDLLSGRRHLADGQRRLALTVPARHGLLLVNRP